MPKPYRRPYSKMWWLRRWPYARFMLREWSATIIAVYVVLVLVLVTKVNDGEAAFEDYVDLLQSPLLIAFHVVALLFALLHTVTWFQALPKAIRVRLGEKPIPPAMMIGPSYVAWAAVSAVVAAIFLLD